MLIGVIFGLLPANKASRLDPSNRSDMSRAVWRDTMADDGE